MIILRQSPYIWFTWLTKLMAGEAQCEWASWFKVIKKNLMGGLGFCEDDNLNLTPTQWGLN